MKYAMCCVPVSALRSEPSHKSEMVSQLLFGECCSILEYDTNNWIKIKCKYDDYEGWCTLSHLIEIDEEFFLRPDKELAANWVNEVNYNGHDMFVPYGSSLSWLQHSKTFGKKNAVKYSGKVWKPGSIKINPKTIKKIAYQFLNTTYLWGGKSVFGIDCSGFSQTVFKFLNIALPRDAWQQAEHGSVINSLQNVNCGDLAFFDNEEGRITHVGILLNSKEIIHSSGKVRIDKVDKEGIINSDTKQRTHKLKIIKRYF